MVDPMVTLSEFCISKQGQKPLVMDGLAVLQFLLQAPDVEPSS